MTTPTLIVEDRHSNRLGWKGKNFISPEGIKAIVISDSVSIGGATIDCLMQNNERREIKMKDGEALEKGWIWVHEDGSHTPL